MRLEGAMMGQQKNIIISGEPEEKKEQEKRKETEKEDKKGKTEKSKESNKAKTKKPKQKKKRSNNYLIQKEFILNANPRNRGRGD